MLNVIKTTAITTLVALSLTATLSTTANAQSYNQYDRNNNDRAAGGVLGAVAGGVIGSQVAGNGARTEGTIIGALLGGYTGASITGNKSRSSYNRGYSNNRRYAKQYSHNSFGHSGFRSNGYDNERHGSGFSRHQGFGQHLGTGRRYKNSGLISGHF